MQNNLVKNILSDFQKFKTSTDIDGNYVGISHGRVFRIVKENKNDFKEILKFINSLPNIISSNIIFEDRDTLIIEHEFLKYISYHLEWTLKQKVEAAIAIITLQNELNKLGYHLFDPHAFNITFDKTRPIYFDLGSIKKGKIPYYAWFLKCFLGALSKDYWGDVIGINIISNIYITIRLYFSSDPYNYLIKKINNYSERFFDRILRKFFVNLTDNEKVIGKINKIFPTKISIITNWTDYKQKDPLLENISDRTKSFLDLLHKYSPEKILDIGANKGAYSKLALEYNVKEAVAADLDETSLDILREDIRLNNLPIYTIKLDLMNYDETPGSFNSYFPAHERFSSQFCLCFALIHHICYFGNHSFEEFSEKISRFAEKIVLVEFVPFTDIHLTGPVYKGKDRTWYTKENFIKIMKKYFAKDVEEYPSNPSPRIILKFEK